MKGRLNRQVFDSFYDAVAYVFSSYSRSKPFRSPGYDRDTRDPRHLRRLLDRLGRPDRAQRNIKITGSKGKGSTSRMLAALLEARGYRVGLFTSPHLIDFTERIRVNGLAIPEADFMALLSVVRGPLEMLQADFSPTQYFGPVGIVAAVAMLYFAQCETDVNVIELGRGARHDDVNALVADLAAVTPVLMEHAQQLGPTLQDIAYSKAGVITEGLGAVVVGRQFPEPAAVLRSEAAAMGVPLIAYGADFAVREAEILSSGTRCGIRTPRAEYASMTIGPLGAHQADNAAVALTVAELFVGAPLAERTVRDALAGLRLLGRGQVLQGTPQVLIDAAINRESAACAKDVILSRQYSRLVLVMGVPVDKDYRGMLDVLGPLSDLIVLTVTKNPHLTFPQDAVDAAQQYRPALFFPTLGEAIGAATRAANTDGMVAIIGTHSLVAEALEYYAVPTRDLAPVGPLGSAGPLGSRESAEAVESIGSVASLELTGLTGQVGRSNQ